jgi:predicted metal-dependent hydrolase
MTNILNIGKTQIEYTIRVSTKAKKKRIVVTPSGVEVVVPKKSSSTSITSFVQGKRKWIFDATHELRQMQQNILTQHYSSGAKLQYRGRWLMIRVSQGDVDNVDISYSSKFEVTIPKGLSQTEQLIQTRNAFDLYLKARAFRESKRFARRHERNLSVSSKNVRISNQKHHWGTCGKDNILRINWRLIQAPAIAMEYVVAHEVTHLLHRNHSEEFWATLSKTMTNWREGKIALERWETEHRAV